MSWFRGKKGQKSGARIVVIMLCALVVISILVVVFSLYPKRPVSYDTSSGSLLSNISTSSVVSVVPVPVEPVKPDFVVTHIPTPDAVRGIYYTNWSVGTPSFRKSMINLLSSTTLNAVVIDVKDYSGRVGFNMDENEVSDMGSVQDRVPDIKELIGQLHSMGIYVIGRVATFQDPFAVKARPEWAVTDKRTGQPWRDSGGAYWLDPNNHEAWKYISSIGHGAYNLGFDEINFDYIRFPSDGAVSSAVYSSSTIYYKIATVTKSASTTKLAATTSLVVAKPRIMNKPAVLKSFFSYLHDQFAPDDIPISVDVFGQTTSDAGDMGIGQHLENAMPYFTAIAPMVYPSHYITGFIGYVKPANYPYQIVKYAMDMAVERAKVASTSPLIFRPWLQAFDLGAIYTPEMVRTQIKATYDAGLTSWLLWNAGSVYKREAIATVVEKTPVVVKTMVEKTVVVKPVVVKKVATTIPAVSALSTATSSKSF